MATKSYTSKGHLLAIMSVLGLAILLVVGIAFSFGEEGVRGLFSMREPGTSGTSEMKRVIGHVVYWDQERGKQSVRSNISVFTDIMPFWYTIEANGDVILHPQGGDYEDMAFVAELQSKGIRVIPTISNDPKPEGGFDAQVVSDILGSSVNTQRHIASIVGLVRDKGYDGVTIDYENMHAADKDAFSRFMKDLSVALHALDTPTRQMVLATALHAKTSEPGTWNGPQAHDYAAVGQAADMVQIMTLDEHVGEDPPGPVASIGWVNQVLKYAASRMPVSKIVQVVPLYGYDWVDDKGAGQEWDELVGKAKTFDATINFDQTKKSPWFNYKDRSNKQHTVWFENSESISHKLDVTKELNLLGTSFWRLGGEDPAVWTVVARKSPARRS
jgi:spore germination protein